MLLKESGFRNRISYRARIDLKKQKQEQNEGQEQINNIGLNDGDGDDDDDDGEIEITTGELIAKGLNDNSISDIDESKFCNECRLQITFDTPKKNEISMQQLQAYFLTSEYVKINTTKNNNSNDDNNNGLSSHLLKWKRI